MRSSFLRLGVLLLVMTALGAFVWAQDNPPILSKITSVEPDPAKIGAQVALLGVGLGKKSVVAVFLSTDQEDFAATVVEQSDGKIVIKIPKVKPGTYKTAIQVEKVILIQPVGVTIQE
jgi:hypothetical protein